MSRRKTNVVDLEREADWVLCEEEELDTEFVGKDDDEASTRGLL